MSFIDEKIRLNIGGTIFETSKSTLTKFDGFFKTLLETDIPIQKDDSNCIFIDRSPRHFEKNLNYLRDGADMDLLPESEKEVREILKEAQFYLLEGLMELCKRSSCKIRTFESYHHLLKLIAEAGKPVLVIFYLVKDTRIVHIPHNFEFLNFLVKHHGKLDIYFKDEQYETTQQNPSQFLPPSREEAAPSWTYCFYNAPKLPFRFTISFVEKLEEDIEFVLGNLNK